MKRLSLHLGFARAGGIALLACALNCANAAGVACDEALAAKAWTKCAACHSMTPQETGKLGPNLHGVIGRKAGSLEQFVFSPALSRADFQWTPEMLDAFLANPQKTVPNNRMPFAGLPNVKERTALVCTLVQSAQ